MDNLPLLHLEPGQVHVWFACPEEVHDPDLLASYHALMNPEERKKQARYLMPPHRHTSLLARAVTRCVLSRYCGIRPHQWVFEANGHGKPEIVRTPDGPPLRFNLSHTNGLVAFAVTLKQDVGVDVERTDRDPDYKGIAARFFSPMEATSLEHLPEVVRKQHFFSVWTLKEAYVKARGNGISFGMDRFSMQMNEDSTPRIVFDLQVEDDPQAWRFWVLKPTKYHKAAVALRKTPGAVCSITSRFVIPLVHEEILQQDN